MNTQPAQQVSGNIGNPTSQRVCATTCSTAPTRPPSRSTPPSSRTSPSSSTHSTGSCAAPTASPAVWPITYTPPDTTTHTGVASYDANLLIDQVSFTAHALRAYRQQPLQ